MKRGPSEQTVSLSCIERELGETREVGSLDLRPEDRAKLLGPEGGLRYHRVSEGSSLELAIASARRTLARWRAVSDRSIDLIVIASCSIAKDQPLSWAEELTAALGLQQVPLQVVNGGDCFNFHLACRLCHGIAATCPSSAVLLLTVDRVADFSPGQFLALNGGGISSDAAASCVIAAGEVAAGYRMGGLFAYAKPDGPQDPSVSPFVETISCLKRALKQLFVGHTVAPQDIVQVITNTHTRAFAEVVALAAKVPLSKVFADNIAETAHCFASDNLINLHAYQRKSDVRAGVVALVGSGLRQWGAFLVESSGHDQ